MIMQETMLAQHCCNDATTKAKNLLTKYSNVDLIDDNGMCFRLAIKNKNAELLNVLLDYYEETALKSDRDTIEYKIAKRKLQEILEDAAKSFDISDEIKVALAKYNVFLDGDIEKLDLINAVCANDIEEAQRLLKSGKIDINLQEEYWHNTALHFACQNSNDEMIQLLIEAGADTLITNKRNLAPKEVINMQHVTEEQLQKQLFDLSTIDVEIEDSSQKVESWLHNQFESDLVGSNEDNFN